MSKYLKSYPGIVKDVLKLVFFAGLCASNCYIGWHSKKVPDVALDFFFGGVTFSMSIERAISILRNMLDAKWDGWRSDDCR
jgi:hypothetical protein